MAGLQAVGSTERRVWRAGATPFPRRLGSAEHSPGNAAPAPSRLAASSQGPLPMTESARRIAEALDSMTKVGSALSISSLCLGLVSSPYREACVIFIARSCGLSVCTMWL